MAQKILIIDDNEKILKMMESRLKVEDYEVIRASNGIAGIEKAKSENPDVILLDIIMPEMDGYEVLKKLKTDPDTESIPVIMVTAKREIEDITKSMSELGAVGYISKPFSAKELLEKVRSALVFFKKNKK
jgi:CheY-like chemotaxis protein